MRRADLADLAAFVTVADNLSFRAAASRIGVHKWFRARPLFSEVMYRIGTVKLADFETEFGNNLT
jgi:hypothetical protein